MIFNTHSSLEGLHARWSASQYAWINYDEDKFRRVFYANVAKQRGDRLHKLAHQMIREGIRPQRKPLTFNMYVNDCITHRMTTEQPLFYSSHFFGTADAIDFRKNFLRVYDLKTGEIEASVHQLEVYAALFCLEYGFSPLNIGIELRIYQNDEARIYEPDPGTIFGIMDTIRSFDKLANELTMEVDEW